MIKVIYNKTCGRCTQSEPLTSGMVGQPIEFEYSPDFDGLTLTAVFTNGKTTVDVLNPGNQCVIPHEVLGTPGTTVSVGIYATKGNELVIPTVYATIGIVLKGADPSGDVSADPTLPVWAQIKALMGNLNDLNTEAKNNLVAAINEVAQSGGGGGGSASIAMRVDGGYIQYSTDNGKTWVNLIAEADLKGDPGTPGTPGTPGKDGAPGVYYGTTQPTGDTHPVWIDPDGGHDDGGLLPAVTAADNGKVLRVVSGAWSPVDMPDKLPNPNALTFTGAVTGSYDGSAPMSVEIPSGGSGLGTEKNWTLLLDETLSEDTAYIFQDLSSPVTELIFEFLAGGDGTHRDVTIFNREGVGYGKNIVTFKNLLRSDTNVTARFAIHCVAFPNLAFFRCQYNNYNSSVGNNIINESSELKFDNEAGAFMGSSNFDCISIGCWSGGNSGVFKEGSRVKVYGR